MLPWPRAETAGDRTAPCRGAIQADRAVSRLSTGRPVVRWSRGNRTRAPRGHRVETLSYPLAGFRGHDLQLRRHTAGSRRRTSVTRRHGSLERTPEPGKLGLLEARGKAFRLRPAQDSPVAPRPRRLNAGRGTAPSAEPEQVGCHLGVQPALTGHACTRGQDDEAYGRRRRPDDSR